MTHNEQTAENFARLQDQLAEIDGLGKGSCYAPDFQTWHRRTGELIESVFGINSSLYEDFQAVLFTPLFLSCRCSDTVFTEAYEQGLQEVRNILTLCLKKGDIPSPP
jgi:hypothetical protein